MLFRSHDHRDLHVSQHSFPTRRSSELSAVQVSASAEAATIVAKVGVAPIDLPQGDSPVRASDKEIAQQYAAMPAGAERLAFLKKNRSAIFKGNK